MYRQTVFFIWTSLVTLARSAAVNVRPGAGHANSLTINESANITDLETLILNGSSPDLRSKEPHCLDSMGTPPLGSCMEALSLMPRNKEQVTFGQRRSIGLVDHVMPYDLISCKSKPLINCYVPAHEPCLPCCIRRIVIIDYLLFLLSADGLCAIRVWANVEGYNREATTNSQLASAVDAILGACLQKRLQGGYIAGLGEWSGS